MKLGDAAEKRRSAFFEFTQRSGTAEDYPRKLVKLVMHLKQYT